MGRTPELNVADATRRLREAATDAKRLEDAGDGWAANEAWERYLTIERALAAHERTKRVSQRAVA